MFAKDSEPKGQAEARQLASEANRGRQELNDRPSSLSLDDFRPIEDVARVLRNYNGLLSRLGNFDAGQARSLTDQLKQLHADLHSLATQLSKRDRLKTGADPGGAETSRGDPQAIKGKEPDPAGIGKPGPVGPRDMSPAESENKAGRILWYNWYFVACLIYLIESLVPARYFGSKSRTVRAVEVANEVVNQAFGACGVSAFRVLDDYSGTNAPIPAANGLQLSGAAIYYLLRPGREIPVTPEEVGRRAFTLLSEGYPNVFPPNMPEPVYIPAILISKITGYPCVLPTAIGVQLLTRKLAS